MPEKKLITIIIVNFNGGELLSRSVRLALASNTPVKIIVSDNASSDNSIKILEQEFAGDGRLTVIRNNSNLGFAKANNVALAEAEGDYILFLNPDCLIQPDTISRLIDVFDNNEQAGMIGCRVLNPDGTEQKGCRRRVPTPWRTFVRVLGLSYFTRSTEWLQGFDMSKEPLPKEPVPVDAISGSLMMVSRLALDDVGPLDEGYFLHCEDLDWCMRFNLKGYSVLFVPDVDVIHFQGFSSKQRPVRVMWHMHKGMMRFYNKFFLRRYPWPLVIVVALGVWLRFFALVAKHVFRSIIAIIRNIFLSIKRALFSESLDNLDTSFLQFKPDFELEKQHVLVLGARSQIGHFLLPRLINTGYQVCAASRNKVSSHAINELNWCRIDLESEDELCLPSTITHVISLVPVWLLASRVRELALQGMQRLIFFSSTSRFTKMESGNEQDRQLALRLADSEQRLIDECEKLGVAWTAFRPTMVYGCGMDKNVYSIARFIRRFGCFIMSGQGNGNRQPVHADDLADACIKALESKQTFKQEYNLSGGETLSYTEMVKLLFSLQGRKPRMCHVNRRMMSAMTRAVSYLPGMGHVSPAMIDRMEEDMCFDHSSARDEFNYAPRAFLETSYYTQPLAVAAAADLSGKNTQVLSDLRGKKVLVTGAGGFIGFSLCRYLLSMGSEVHAVLRDKRQLHELEGKVIPVVIDDLCTVDDWQTILSGIDAVVHLAGYVHERAGNLSEQARLQCTRLNVDVTRALATAAASTGVKRFVYVSSVKVHGETSSHDQTVTEGMDLYPEGSYAESKLLAEKLLLEIEAESDMEAVIIRPPLVYGPGVKANFLRLMKLVERGIPLPLAAVENRRSFIYLENLVDVLALSLVHKSAGGETFLVSDDEGVSTPVLINMLAGQMNVPPRLFPISVQVMQLLAAVGGERSTVDRLVQSLVINTTHVRKTLDWTPPYTMEQGISKTVYWYQQLYDPVQSKQSRLAAYASSW